MITPTSNPQKKPTKELEAFTRSALDIRPIRTRFAICKLALIAAAVGLLCASPAFSVEESVNLGVSIPAATHSFTAGIVHWANEAKKELEKAHPGLKVTVKTAGSAPEQANQLQDLLTVTKINTLVIFPFESASLTKPVAQLKNKGVYVTVVDRGLTDTSAQDAYVSGDKYLTYFADGGAITLDNALSDVYSPVYYGSLLGIQVPVWVFAVVAIIGGVILNRTAYGRYVQAIGSNEQVARYAAVDVDRIKVITYMLLGVCVGVATLLYVPRLGSASPSTGLLWELEAIAAVIVGGTALKGGAGSITGTVIGAILLSVISNILNLTNIISVYLNAAVQGFVIIVVAFMQRRRK